MTFRVGDRVRRKKEFQNTALWSQGNNLVTVTEVDQKVIKVSGSPLWWDAPNFEPDRDAYIQELEEQLAKLKAEKEAEDFSVAAHEAMEHFQIRIQSDGLPRNLTRHYTRNGFVFSVQRS